MTNLIFDATNPLPGAGMSAELELPDAGSVILDLDVASAALKAIQAAAALQLIIGSGRTIHGFLDAIELKGAGNTLNNGGTIAADTGTGVLFSGAGTHTVTNSTAHTISGVDGIKVSSAVAGSNLFLLNSGTITGTTGLAIQGGLGDD